MHALVLAAITAGALALSDAPDLPQALASADPLLRATAARIALTRDDHAALPAIRTAFAAEQDGDAAREELRVLVILGTDDDVALAAAALPRFPGLERVFADAVARTGATRAVDLALRYHAERISFHQVLWNHPELVTVTASRILGAHDDKLWASLLFALQAARLDLPPAIAQVALASSDEAIRVDTLWFYVRAKRAPASLPPAPENAGVRELFARELLARIGGAKPHDDPRFETWLDTPESKHDVRTGGNQFLTRSEAKHRKNDLPRGVKGTNAEDMPLDVAGIALPSTLPPGLAASIMAAAPCADEWLGVVSAATEPAGRVTAVDVTKVTIGDACKRALVAMIGLSLASPRHLATPHASNSIIAVNAAGRTPCLDEAPLAAYSAEPHPIGGGADVVAPKAVERVEPHIPAGLRSAQSTTVGVEAVITSTGCVRDIRIVKPSPLGGANASAVAALAKWKFQPGTLNGVPVDVLFNLTFSFRAN